MRWMVANAVVLVDNADNDDGVVVRARDGDPSAWDELYRACYPRLLAYAGRRTGRDSAGDIVAETMARAVESVHRYDPAAGRFEAWLFGICRLVVLQHVRRTGRGRVAPVVEATSGGDLADGVQADEEASAMRAAYARLTSEERELLDLRVIAALTAEEVGTILGRRPGAVRMAQSRALTRLRIFYEEVYR